MKIGESVQEISAEAKVTSKKQIDEEVQVHINEDSSDKGDSVPIEDQSRRTIKGKLISTEKCSNKCIDMKNNQLNLTEKRLRAVERRVKDAEKSLKRITEKVSQNEMKLTATIKAIQVAEKKLSEITKIVKGKKKQATNKVKVHGKMEPKTNGFLITKKSQGIVSSNTELKEKANQKPEDIPEDKLVILLPSYLRLNEADIANYNIFLNINE